MNKIVFLIAEDWYFLSHRKILAETCLKASWEVVFACVSRMLRDKVVEAARRLAETRFDQIRIVERHLALYTSLCGDRS